MFALIRRTKNITSPLARYASEGFTSRPQGEGYTSRPQGSRVEKCINQVTLMGRVGGDPQLRGPEDRQVVTFSLATNIAYRNNESGEFQTKTEWHRIALFKPQLRDAVYKYITKGMRLYVEGRIVYGEITDSSGVKHNTTTISANDVIFLTSPRRAEEAVEAEGVE